MASPKLFKPLNPLYKAVDKDMIDPSSVDLKGWLSQPGYLK
jgi:hypothetical protein